MGFKTFFLIYFFKKICPQSSAAVFGTFISHQILQKKSEEILERMGLRQGTAYLNNAVPYFVHI